MSTINSIRFLKPDEVQSMLGFRSPKTFWAFVHSSKIPHTRISQRRIVFEEKSLLSWLEKRSVGHVHLKAGEAGPN